ncbi:MAG TPA: hypothetical protein ENN14_02085 [Chloroflexi bacterium]|nr:hypothetical protein [Chloroflexota bacterium]
MPSKPPFNPRRYRRQLERQLLIGVVIVLVGMGSLLIGLIYGWPAVWTALLCLLPGAGVLVLLWIFFWGLEKLTQDK